MAAASKGKRGPVSEIIVKPQVVMSTQPKKKTKSKSSSSGPPGAAILNETVTAIKSTVEEAMNPTQASLIPRMPRQPLYPSFYPGSLSLKASNGANPFKGQIVVRPDLDNFIEILTDNGGTVSASAAKLVSNLNPYPIQIELNHFYSVPFRVETSSGTLLQEAILRPVDEDAANQYHYMDDLGVWRTGAIWVVNGTLSSVSTNANFTGVRCTSNPASGGVTIAQELWLGQFEPTGPQWNTPIETQLVDGTSTYALADLTPGAGFFTVAFLATVETANPLYFGFTLNAVDLLLNTTSPVVLPIGPEGSSIYTAIRQRATAYSITRFFANLAWRGSDAYDAGNVASALVPHNLALAEGNPTLLIDEIGRLPYRKSMTRPLEGAHVSYMPQRVQDLFLTEKGSRIKGNEIVIAFDCPPTGSAGQAAAFLLTWGACVEWEIDDPSLPQLIPPWGKDCYDEIIGVLGDINPASGNPEHLEKIKQAIKAVASHPAVKESAKMALQVAKQGAKVAIPTLLALL